MTQQQSTSSECALVIDGKKVCAPEGMSIIEAFWHAGHTLVEQVGCMQGVCGSCRVMVQREGSREVAMELACETLIEGGMKVNFITHEARIVNHVYDIKDVTNSWEAHQFIDAKFPEGINCRHCGGCDSACPRGLDVQKGVEAATGNLGSGRSLMKASEIFEECVMCNLCNISCPENIAPNNLGLLLRRLRGSLLLRPNNLMNRVDQIRRGEMTLEYIETPKR